MSASQEALFLSVEDVVQAGGTDIGAAIEDVERGFELHQAGKVVEPHKVILNSSGAVNNGFNLLPAIVDLGDREVFGCKLLGSNPANVERGMPRAIGLLALFDGETKEPLAVMDGQVVSAMRTGAVSGLAARHLVDAETEAVGLIGAGVNMRTQLLGLAHELPKLESVAVHSKNGSKRKFAEAMSARTGLEITPNANAKDVVSSHAFNVLCTTKPASPLIERDWLQRTGVTVFNISGVATPADALGDMDRLVTDSWEDCANRNTQTLPRAVEESIVDTSRIEELGEILESGDGRRSGEENIFFCPVGLAFEDVMVGWRVYQAAKEKALGQEVALWSDPDWI